MKVTGWTDWDDEKYEMKMRDDKYFEAIKEVTNEVRNKGYYFSGDYHQNGDCGVPIIDNKYKLCLTKRKWGSIMAEAHSEEIDNSDNLAYCVYAWESPNPSQKHILPKSDKL